MKQYRITSENINQSSDDDCYLDPSDPIHELIIAHNMGGLGSEAKLAEYRSAKHKYTQPIAVDDRAQKMREQNIRPGTAAWFALWFGKK